MLCKHETSCRVLMRVAPAVAAAVELELGHSGNCRGRVPAWLVQTQADVYKRAHQGALGVCAAHLENLRARMWRMGCLPHSSAVPTGCTQDFDMQADEFHHCAVMQ